VELCEVLDVLILVELVEIDVDDIELLVLEILVELLVELVEEELLVDEVDVLVASKAQLVLLPVFTPPGASCRLM
jgi:hypothetical protein